MSLSQAEGKSDNYVEKNKNLKAENSKLLEEVERKTKEHQQKIIDTRKGTRVNSPSIGWYRCSFGRRSDH